jgi:arylsulfatase
MITLGGFAALESAEFLSAHIDKFGGPEAYNHYAVGWAHAMDAPYQWTKQVASHWGGTRNGTIVHWPKGIQAKGELRHQFHHVIDVAPTVLTVAGLPAPVAVDGVQQKPLEGVSMAYSFDDADAAERHTTQYFEMFGNRGIYHQGWTAVTKHRTPWQTGSDAPLVAFDDDRWELYAPDDWTQAHDLAADQPDRLAHLQRLWLIEAVKYGVVPLDDRFVERANAELSGRPTLVTGKKQRVYPGVGRLTEWAVLDLKNKSYSMTANVSVPDDHADGVIVALGGLSGGMSLYAKGGKAKFCYNFFGLEQTYVETDRAIPAGTHQVRVEFAYDGGGLAKGGAVTLYLDGAAIGTGRLERTQPFVFSGDESLDLGDELGSAVTTDYPMDKRFTGTVHWVELEAGLDDHSHLIAPEDRLALAMARQ